MACRDLSKCEETRAKIVGESFNTNVVCRECDFASLDSIRRFAEEINQNEKSLHLLINNAGVMWHPAKLTKDGFEQHLGVNYLGVSDGERSRRDDTSIFRAFSPDESAGEQDEPVRAEPHRQRHVVDVQTRSNRFRRSEFVEETLQSAHRHGTGSVGHRSVHAGILPAFRRFRRDGQRGESGHQPNEHHTPFDRSVVYQPSDHRTVSARVHENAAARRPSGDSVCTRAGAPRSMRQILQVKRKNDLRRWWTWLFSAI